MERTRRFLSATVAALALWAPLAGGAEPPPSSGWVDGAAEAARTLAQRARAADEILVIWLLDQTPSMRDDREALAREIDALTRELKKKAKGKDALRMAVYGVGAKAALIQGPTGDRKLVARAMRELREDESGTENWMGAVLAVLAEHRDDPAQKIVVLVTDEEAEDAARVDAAEQELLAQKAQFFCIGTEAAFQTSALQVRVHYTHEGKKLQDNVALRAGPESAEPELAAGPDRFAPKEDDLPPGMGLPGGQKAPPPEGVKIPSGFGFYTPSRLAASTEGMYLMVPDPKPSPLQIDRKKVLARYQPSYAPDREPPSEYGRRVKAALAEARKACPGGAGGGEPVRIMSMNGSGLKEIEGMIAGYREAADRIGACEARLREAAGDLKKKKKDDYQGDSRWEANALLSLVILGEEKARLLERSRLLREAIDDGDFDACRKAEKMGLQLTFTRRPAGKLSRSACAGDGNIPAGPALLALLLDRHAGTPWAHLARRIEKEAGVESMSIAMVTPPKDKKKQASPPPGLPAPPAPPPQ